MIAPQYVIVVGVDYSAASTLAFERALELAATKPKVELHVVNVYLPDGDAGPFMGVGGVATSLASAKTSLEDHVARTVSEFQARTGCTPFIRLVTHTRFDDPGHQIAQLAADVEADLVVVGTHGRRGLPRLIMGSVAETVLRMAPCPVLAVRPKAVPAPLPPIEPPCPRCVEARQASAGARQWCEQHRERHGQRHTYHQGDRASADTNFPLVGGS
jgi:nucleotide-binding universal stress UspA family protein